VAACGVLAGCGGSDGPAETSDTPSASGAGFEGPAPLGFRAVPDGAADPPTFDRTRTYETSVDSGLVDILDRREGSLALAYTRSQDGYGEPVLRRIGAEGETTGSRTPSGLPSNRVFFLERGADGAVLGGHRESDDRRATWFRGVGGQSFSVDTGLGTVYADVAADGETFLAAGSVRESAADRREAVSRRYGPDGEVVWERTTGDPETDVRFWTVSPVSDGVLAGGSIGGDILLVKYGPNGSESWRSTVRDSEEAYHVIDLAVGATGTYAVAETNQFAQGNNHAILLSLSSDGAVEWARVFDPNYDEYASGPLDLFVVGIVDDEGPVLAGRANGRAWLAAADPEGGLRWAGYRSGEEPLRPLGFSPADDGFAMYGSRGVPRDEGEDPWLAWL
jgi:hypothetical protein